MPRTRVVIFKKLNGRVPVLEWLKRQSAEVQDKAVEYAKKLRAEGHKLGPPLAKPLRDGIWELRPIVRRVQHRILYTFVGEKIVLLTHGLTKESEVPAEEINKAIKYKREYLQNPEIHTHQICR